jgi:hypothetical protein
MFAEFVDEYLYYYKEKYNTLEANNGWFFSTADNIKERTGWSADKQERIIQVLIEKGLIQKKVAGVPAKRFFYINTQKAQNLVNEYHETTFRKKRKLDSANYENLIMENAETIIRISKKENLKTKSKKDTTTASGSSFNENLVNLFMQEKYPYLEPITASALKSFVNNILKEEQKQKGIEITKEHAYTFFAEIITKFFPNINENSVSANNAHTQTTYQGNLDNSTNKENLTVEAVKTSKAELQKQDEIENFVNEHNSFNENEVALITEYIIDRKTIYKSKVKNTKQALNGLLCDIAEVKKQIPLEWVFQKDGDIYSNCGTAGDKTKPFQTIKIDYFKNVLQQAKQKPTHNRMITPQKIDIDLSEMEQFNFTTL